MKEKKTRLTLSASELSTIRAALSGYAYRRFKAYRESDDPVMREVHYRIHEQAEGIYRRACAAYDRVHEGSEDAALAKALS